ncbi:MAG: cytochrome C [Gammaproteobacteria bacterium]|nr:MAG: cytochrome C [Gammaproteobacteria bacterium]
MKQVSVLTMMLIFIGMAQVSYADNNGSMEQMKHHNMKHSMNDERISLGLSPKMKQHQLANMRSHLEAVQAIISLIAEKEFEKASEVAHSKLGLTEEMQKMCNMFKNDDFKFLGLAFHKSGDVLGETLKSKDTHKSLRALQTTVGYCVQCHATFRQ